MTEDPETAGGEQPAAGAPEPGPEPDPVRTGVIHVDEVIAAVEQLEQRPIEEHVGVFETAHEQLRRALDHPARTPESTAPTESSSDPS